MPDWKVQCLHGHTHAGVLSRPLSYLPPLFLLIFPYPLSLIFFCSQTIWWTRPRWKPAKQKPLNWKRRWNKKRFIHIDRWEYLTHVYTHIHTNTSTQRPASDYSHIRQKRKSHIVKINISPYTCKHNGIEMKFCATTVCLTGADKCLKKKKGGWWGCRKWLRK